MKGLANGSTKSAAEQVFNAVEHGLETAFGWGSGMAPQGVLYKDIASAVKEDDRDTLMTALGVDHLAIASLVISRPNRA